MQNDSSKMKEKIVVIGGGFAGLELIQSLPDDVYEIWLIDKSNHHQFQPLFYQVATSQIEPSSISFPFRKIFQRRKDVRIRLAHVEYVDQLTKKVITDIGSFSYDILVIATGGTTNFFGNKNIENNALTLKSTYQAIQIRNTILENFEKLIHAENLEKESLNNIVIVGGGPTGVELAGAFAEIKKDVLPKDFYRIDFSKMRIILVEGSPHTLNALSSMSRNASRKYLEELGVSIMTNTIVEDYDGLFLKLNNGQTIITRQVIWAAGIKGNLIKGFTEDQIGPGQRYFVDRYNKVLGTENIYALGDVALMRTEKYPKGHPQVANVALNQAKLLAKNLSASKNRISLVPFEYNDLGSMATIGRHKAVVEFPFVKFTGYFAWFVWMFLHLMLILNVRNKIIIFINWAWNYFSKNSSLRLILKDYDKDSVTIEQKTL